MKKENIIHLQNSLGVNPDGDIGPITRKAYADKLIRIGSKEIGVSEIGKSNTGKRVKEYQASTSLGGTGWPWCSAFIVWIFLQAGFFDDKNRPKTAAAFEWEDFGYKIGMKVIESPESILRGDIVIWSFSHISIATSDSGKSGSFLSLEGNTNEAGSREGGSVLEKFRTIPKVRSVIRL